MNNYIQVEFAEPGYTQYDRQRQTLLQALTPSKNRRFSPLYMTRVIRTRAARGTGVIISEANAGE